jgi:hypothetical protein
MPEAGLGRLAELSAESAGKLLPKVVHLLVPLVSSFTVSHLCIICVWVHHGVNVGIGCSDWLVC